MKIITLWQPWATFIALNLKGCETRSWETGYRGKIAIHAAKRHIDPDGKYVIRLVHELTDAMVPHKRNDYPLGCIIAIADLVDCRCMDTNFIAEQSDLELALGYWQSGRFAWQLDNILALPEPIPYRGSQGLCDVRPETLKILTKRGTQCSN